MDLSRFLELYVAETQEHLSSLGRTLLALESGSAAAIAEAFRSAHTIKGLSAAMGYGDVARTAHRLEDTLEQVRAGTVTADAALVDSLLGTVDELAAAIAHAVANRTPQLDAGEEQTAPEPVAQVRDVPVPAGTARVAVVRLRDDAPIKAARATIILNTLAGSDALLGSHPATFGDDFDGVFQLFFTGAVDEETVRAAVVGAGDVAAVDFRDDAAPTSPVAAAAARVRHVRVEEGRLDGVQESLGELSILQHRLRSDMAGGDGSDVVGRMDRLLTELQRDVLKMRMVSLDETFQRLPRVVRDAARTLGKDVDLVMSGEDVELDRSILNELGDPLIHLLRNAVDHGLETPAEREAAGKPPRGTLRIDAERERSSVRVTVSDDGRGVDRDRVLAAAVAAGLIAGDASPGDDARTDDEIFRLLSHPGFSTAETVTELSGRGVGLDAVVSGLRALGGAIEMRAQDGEGTTFVITLPTTRALAHALRVRVAGEDYAIPLTHVSEAIELDSEGVRLEQVRVRDELIPLIRLRRKLLADTTVQESAAVIAQSGERRAALAVDELVGREQILIRNFDPAAGTLPYFSGATLLDDGRPALVLDPLSVM